MSALLRSWIYGSSTETDKNNSAATKATSPVPTTTAASVTLSVTDTTIDDQDDHHDRYDDDTPPAFPSLDSIQRLGPPSISVSVSRSANGFSRAKRDAELMPPPPNLPSHRELNNGSRSSLNPRSYNQLQSSNSIPDTLSPYGSHSLLNGSITSSSSTNNSLLPPSTIKPPTLTPKQRQKVALAPGHSTLDWAVLKKSGKDLRGVPTLLRVTPSMLKLHRHRDDAWTSIHDKVYNISHYLDFHPGGVKELMRVAGRDGTKLFVLTHSWVNVELMLDDCLVGFLVPEPSSSSV